LSPCSSPYGDTVSKEIQHKVASQYSNQVRDELLTNKLLPANESVSTEKNEEFENPTSTLRQRKTELLSTIKTNTTPTLVQDFDGVISNQQQTQEEITNNLLTMAKTMKEQTMSANSIIRQDLVTLEKANILAEENQTNLQTQTQKLQERSGFCTRCWVWLFLLLVCMSFIGKLLLCCNVEVYFMLTFLLSSYDCVYAVIQEEEDILSRRTSQKLRNHKRLKILSWIFQPLMVSLL